MQAEEHQRKRWALPAGIREILESSAQETEGELEVSTFGYKASPQANAHFTEAMALNENVSKAYCGTLASPTCSKGPPRWSPFHYFCDTRGSQGDTEMSDFMLRPILPACARRGFGPDLWPEAHPVSTLAHRLTVIRTRGFLRVGLKRARASTRRNPHAAPHTRPAVQGVA